MLEKNEILIVILVLLFLFYFVIFWGAGKRRKSSQSHEIKNYLIGVRILIIIIGIVSFVLWLFL